jgi:iron complex outermembrane receptor protein
MQTENVTTFDVDFQYRFPLGDRHSITCGAGYRNVQSYFAGGDTFPYQDYPTPTPTFYKYFSTPYWTTNYPTQFVQDEISLVPDRWTFIMGCKLEENPYTNLEYQPSVRLMWTPDKKQTMWGAITRAVHTPTREDEQISVTIPTAYSPLAYARYEGDPNVTSEALIAYEVGYRAQVTDRFSWDVATFYNVYNSLEGVQNPATFWETLPDPAHFVWLVNPETVLSGESYGVELACNYKMSERWRLFAQYTYLHMQVQSTADITAATLADPNNRIALRSSWDLGSNMDFDLTARYVDRLIDPGISYAGMNVPAYIEMDMRLAWRPRDHWEVALVGQNLLHQHHYEFAGGNDSFPIYATEVPRSVYSTLTWRH